SNALRHAEARSVCLTFRIAPGTLAVEISDDGRGMDRPTVGSSPADRCHLSAEPVQGAAVAVRSISTLPRDGMANMQARVRALGGKITCKSSQPNGTRVQIHVPLPGSNRIPGMGR